MNRQETGQNGSGHQVVNLMILVNLAILVNLVKLANHVKLVIMVTVVNLVKNCCCQKPEGMYNIKVI